MRKANKAARTAFTSRRYRELMQNNRFECYKHLDPQPQSDVAICPHHHAFYEIIFVVQGDLFYEVEGKAYHLKRGDVILIDELQFHHGLIHHHQNYERYALWIHPKYMQLLSRRFPKLDPQYCFLQLNSDNNNVVHLDQSSFEELEHDLAHLFSSYWSKTPSDEVLSESYFAIILTKLNQIVHRQHCAQLHAAVATAAAVAGAHAPVNGLAGEFLPTGATLPLDEAMRSSLEEGIEPPHEGDASEADAASPSSSAVSSEVDMGDASVTYAREHNDNGEAVSGLSSMGSNTVFFNNSRSASHTIKLEPNQSSAVTELAGSADLKGSLAGKLTNPNLSDFAQPDDAAAAYEYPESAEFAGEEEEVASGGGDAADVDTIPALAPASTLYEIVTLLHDPRDANDVFNADPKLSAENWELNWEYDNGRYSAHYVDVTDQKQSTGASLDDVGAEFEAEAEAAAADVESVSSGSSDSSDSSSSGEDKRKASLALSSGYSVISSQLSTHQTPLEKDEFNQGLGNGDGALGDDISASDTNEIALAAQDDGSKPAPIVTRSDESQYNYHLDDDMHLNLNLSERLKLSALLKYINLHINENLSLDELSQRFSLSKFYLTRRFKELTGLSLHQFIVKKRLTKARYLISVGVDPYRAAVDAGFNNYSHFSRTFKSYFGQNPSSIPQAHAIHHGR